MPEFLKHFMKVNFFLMVIFLFRICSYFAEIKFEMGCCHILLNGIKRIVSPPGQTPLDPKLVITIFLVNVGIQQYVSTVIH